MGGNKSGIIHNQTEEEVYYTLHSVDKVPQALVTKMSFGVKAGANSNEGVNAGGKGEYTRELKEKFAAKEGICVLPPGRIGQAGLKKISLDSPLHFSLVSESRDILTNIAINDISNLCFVIKREDFSVAYLSANKTRRMKELMKSEEMRSGVCSKCSRRANQYEFEAKIACTVCKDANKEAWVCQVFPLQHLICSYCHELDNHREPQQELSQLPNYAQYEGEEEMGGGNYDDEGEEEGEGEFEEDEEDRQASMM